MFRLYTFFVAALATIQSDAFTLSTATYQDRVKSNAPSSRLAAINLDTGVCDVNCPVLIDRERDAYTVHQSRHLDSSELSDIFEKWSLHLFNDSSNTRTYVCRCLVEVTGLSEEESYQKMRQAHEYGEAVIGEYSQEHAEHYKEALSISGLVSEIIPVEE
eukprot:CAMPEP_0181075720 /NCGR_PEP_ID=MMETSP1071-20121207/36_1 /TAXON_ID=35127 /ORGANISM="Thalassiosira sp., Strain NH16" /LENGTH=159 /DNA_ID=CAMNT_0023156853 /DNA_START=115 /DNA_END=594 /DNA_ORIENTATION=+